MNTILQDAGNVIPGAKKFNYNHNTDSRELIQKTSIWPRPKYSDGYDDFIIKYIYNSIRKQARNYQENEKFEDAVYFLRNVVEETFELTYEERIEELKSLVYEFYYNSYRTKYLFHRTIRYYKVSERHYEEEKNKVSVKRKKSNRVVPIYNDPLIHEGLDIRGGFNKTSDDLVETYDLFGVQFGNYLNAKDRQNHNNQCYDSLYELSKVLNIKSEYIGFRGKLGIAFGARGKGKANAHYEPLLKVINLTKYNGAGSLAHEYGHFLDNMFNTSDTLNFRTEYYEKDHSVMDEIKKILDNPDTEYYKNSSIIDAYENRSKSYWNNTQEKFARAFNAFVFDKLATLGIRNDYLASECKVKTEDDKALITEPLGEEREKLNSLFEEFIKEIKEVI